MSGQHHIVVGKITGLSGVAGWVKVQSYTHPTENIVGYSEWRVVASENVVTASSAPTLESARYRNGRVMAKFKGVDDRSAAATLLGCQLAIDCNQLPSLPQDTYYWFQLLGLEVMGAEGRTLGVVKGLLETGANDVLAIEGESGSYLIPYVSDDYVQKVDLEQGRMQVNWRSEWKA